MQHRVGDDGRLSVSATGKRLGAMSINLRTVAALTGGCAVAGMGLLGLSVESRSTAPGVDAVLAPATGPSLDEVTTTSVESSFRPLVTATQPAPPT